MPLSINDGLDLEAMEGEAAEYTDHAEQGKNIEPTPELFRAYLAYYVDAADAQGPGVIPDVLDYDGFVAWVDDMRENNPEDLYLQTLKWKMGYAVQKKVTDAFRKAIGSVPGLTEDWMDIPPS